MVSQPGTTTPEESAPTCHAPASVLTYILRLYEHFPLHAAGRTPTCTDASPIDSTQCAVHSSLLAFPGTFRHTQGISRDPALTGRPRRCLPDPLRPVLTTHWCHLSPPAASELSNSTPLPLCDCANPTPPISTPTTRRGSRPDTGHQAVPSSRPLTASRCSHY